MKNPSSDFQLQIEKGISILKQGGLVAYPTDTVYGLGACVILPQSVERVYRVKDRPRKMPFPWLLADTSDIAKITETISPEAQLLIDRFLPGSLTLVLPKSKSLPDEITAGTGTIAFRIPDHPVPQTLIKELGTPIIGTSANISGKPSPLTADEVKEQLGDSIDLVIDGGRCPGGKESTIIDLSGEKPVLLREGAISKEEIESVIDNIVLKGGSKP